MKNWFGHSVEEKTNSDSASEEHHEPGDPVVLGWVGVLAQFEVGVFAEVKHHQEDCTKILEQTIRDQLPIWDGVKLISLSE